MMLSSAYMLYEAAYSHHTQWGSADVNTRLNIRNVGNTPIFRNLVREAVIDITLPNMDRSIIRDWRVANECSISDYQLMPFSINLSSGFHKPFRNARSDWIKFEKAVEEERIFDEYFIVLL